jgi:uncharacterized membrane protein
MTVWSALGLIASAMLSIDKVKLLIDPSFQPSCNFNPVLSCGSVMKTDQASLFGFPNSFLGLVGFSVMLTLAVLVAAEVVLPRWVVAGAAVGAVLGAVFVHWLAFQSLYRIGALCPWCMVVWAVTIPTAVWLVIAAARSYLPDGGGRVAEGFWEWRFTLVGAWYLAVFVLILVRFWDYWRTLV